MRPGGLLLIRASLRRHKTLLVQTSTRRKMAEEDEFGTEWARDWSPSEMDQLGQATRNASTDSSLMSPMSRFRRRAWLSVTDWSSPAWCECQSMYRLEAKAAQRRLKPGEVLQTFSSKAGNVIEINLDEKAKRETILERGRSVHSDLERKVMGDLEPVHVDTASREEVWALRVINTIAGLAVLKASGTTRELPVLGLVNGVLTFGVIDQVEKRLFKLPPSTTATKSPQKKKSSPPPPPGQKTLEAFFPSPTKKSPPVPSTAAKSSPPPPTDGSRYGYVVSDSKTRYTKRLPQLKETKGSKMQLMLYRRMLEDMVTGKTDWSAILDLKRIDRTKTFSDAFIASVMPILDSIAPVVSIDMPTTLDHVIAILPRVVDLPIEYRLEIVYFTREQVRKTPPVSRRETRASKRRKTSPSPTPSLEATAVNDLEDELAMQDIILEDLKKRSAGGDQVDPPLETTVPDGHVLASVISHSSQKSTSDAPVVEDIQESQIVEQAPSPSSASSSSSSTVTSPPPSFYEAGHKIGTQTFRFDPGALDKWLDSMAELWLGKRPPRGVDIEDTFKCRTCEFAESCEWRAQKAAEPLSKSKAKVDIDIA